MRRRVTENPNLLGWPNRAHGAQFAVFGHLSFPKIISGRNGGAARTGSGPALKSGAIDASEWIGPWLDVALGLHEAASYYYYPGFHEPCAAQAASVNRGVWESLDASHRQVIEAIAAGEYTGSLAEFNANNALSLRKLRDEGTVKILKFDDSLLKAFLGISKDAVAEIGSGDDLSKKIYASYQQFAAYAGESSGYLSRLIRPLVATSVQTPRSIGGSRGTRIQRAKPPSLASTASERATRVRSEDGGSRHHS